MDTSNKYDIHSCVTPHKPNHSAQDTYTPPRLKLLNTTVPIVPVRLHTRTKLSPVGKEYLLFQINSKSPHAAQCVK